mgnify:FL=1|jgi:hypothetical protein
MILLFLVGCPVAMADDYPKPPSPCVITVCEEGLCTVETPEGSVKIEEKPHYEEGVHVVCPLWLIEPT